MELASMYILYVGRSTRCSYHASTCSGLASVNAINVRRTLELGGIAIARRPRDGPCCHRTWDSANVRYPGCVCRLPLLRGDIVTRLCMRLCSCDCLKSKLQALRGCVRDRHESFLSHADVTAQPGSEDVTDRSGPAVSPRGSAQKLLHSPSVPRLRKLLYALALSYSPFRGAEDAP